METLSATIHLLGDMLGQVICEIESPELFDVEERIRSAAKERRAGGSQAAEQLKIQVSTLSNETARGVAAAFTTYFDLINLAEEHQRVCRLRETEVALHPHPREDSISAAIASLKTQGVTPEQMQSLLQQLSIELVLTAHPTEARRRTVLSKIQRIAALLEHLNEHSPAELQKTQSSLLAEITALWLTDRHRTTRPAITDEVRTGLYFIESVFWETLPTLYTDLERALESHYPGLAAPDDWLHLASWIGGDRDGHPNVTHEVTAETLRLHRGLAVESHRRSLQELARRLSMSSKRLPPPPALEAWLDAHRPFPHHAAYIEERYANEPYRLILSLLAANLKEASREDMTARLLQRRPHLAHTRLNDLLEPVDLIRNALPRSLKQAEIQTFRRQLKIFGLQSARLDIREESTRFNETLSETLRALNLSANFTDLEESERIALLSYLLATPPPELSEKPGATKATAETWAIFRLMARAREVYGPDLLGPVIISMCHSPADVLGVLLLARWAGCDDELQIVPLFETIDDLRRAPDMLEALFSLPVYRSHIKTCQDAQMVMIGYSDSNKDGGYVMANWSLYQAQEHITQVAASHQIALTIFHGRGGTIARGGGPANRAIRAQPVHSINGRFRVTEQGEVIAARYSNPALAHRHLEQIVHAVFMASSPVKKQETLQPEWRANMDSMSLTARRAYRELVYETPGFIEFWQHATPIEEIKRMYIGSRPAARTPSDAVVKIRAIPWVFSWMQSRFNLPGWYSLGTALASIPNQASLRDMYLGWDFFTTLLDNVEMSLLKADMDIAALYVELVPDQGQAKNLFKQIRHEYDRACEAVLKISAHTSLLEKEPVTRTAVHLRNPYVDPLNYIQVEMLRRLRALPDPESKEALALREVIALTINGIAAGLRNTG